MASNKSIQYINPTDLSLIVYDGKNFQNSSKKEKLYTVSRAFYKDVILYSFKIPKNQMDEELSSVVEIKMYEEAGLDVNKTYKMTYLVKELDFDEICLIEVFAVAVDELEKTLEETIKKVKYIDYLALPFFAFETFYTNKILTPNKNDIFVYIGDNEAFFTFYKNGKYISTKSVYSLKEIAQSLDSKGVNIQVDEFSVLLMEKGLDLKLYNPNEAELFLALESIFSDILTKINNVAMHNRNVFGFDKIDRLFLSTKRGRIKGFKEFGLNFGFEDIEILDFNLFKQKLQNNYLDAVVCSFGFDSYMGNTNAQNITIFEKPPSFLTTKTGKLTLSLVILVVILSVVYIYLYIDIKNQKLQKDILESKFKKIENRAKIYRREIQKEIKEIKKVQKDLNKEEIVYKNINSSVSELESIKGSDSVYTDFLKSVNLLLQRYRLKARSIEQNGQTKMTIEVISSYAKRDDISKFIKSLISKGFLNVTTKEIKLNDKRYISKIEIEHE